MLQLTAARRALGSGGADLRQPIGPSSANAFQQYLSQAIPQLVGKELHEAAGAGGRRTIVVPALAGASTLMCRARRSIYLQPASALGAACSLRAHEGAR